MVKKSIFFVLSVLIFTFMSYAEDKAVMSDKLLTYKNIISHKSYAFVEIDKVYLAGLSGPRFSDSDFEKVKEIADKFIKENLDKDGKIKVKIEKDVSTGKNGKTYERYYGIIYGKNSTLNEYLLEKGIVYLNKYSKKYYNMDKMNELENKAKELKLYKWAK